MRVLVWILTVYVCRVHVAKQQLSNDDPLVLNFTGEYIIQLLPLDQVDISFH